MKASEPQTGKSIVRSVLYGFSTWAFPLLLGFVVTPIVIGSLGTRNYGIYVLVLGFVGYSFNLNFVRAITKYLAEYRAAGREEKVNDVISAALRINLPIGLAGVSILLILSNWLVDSVLLVPEADRQKTVYALYLGAGIMFFTLIGQMFNAVYQGLHRFDVFSRLFNLNSGLLLAGNAALAYCGYGLRILLAWNLVLLVLMAVTGALVTRRLLPELRIRLAGANPELKRILGFSAGIIGYQILSNALLLFERGWVMRKLGSEAVAHYVVPLTLGIQLHGLIASLMMVMFPLTSELSGNRPRLRKVYEKATKLALFLVIFISASILVQGREFLTLWLGREFSDSSWMILSVHALAFGLLAVQVVTWQMNEGLGRTSFNFAVYGIFVAVSVTLMIGLTESLGGVGVALGRLAGLVAISASVFVIERKIFGTIDLWFWVRTGGSLLAAGACASLIEFGLLSSLPVSWLSLLVSTGAGFLGYALITLISGIISEEEMVLIKGMAAR